jgi:WhiB family redox-sensing transcriptional regulator
METPSLAGTWPNQAACRQADPDLFFEEDGESDHRRQLRERQALAVCSSCPVAAACLEAHAGERFGIWGGLTESDRRRRVRRPAPAPLKAAA